MKLNRLKHPEDMSDLPETLRLRVVETLARLKKDPALGKMLTPPRAHQRFRAPIHGLRSAVVASMDYGAEVRVVYDVQDDQIEVVAIGLRQGSEVYKLAADRIAETKEE